MYSYPAAPALGTRYALTVDVSPSVVCHPLPVPWSYLGYPVKHSKQTPASCVINKWRRSHCINSACGVTRKSNSEAQLRTNFFIAVEIFCLQTRRLQQQIVICQSVHTELINMNHGASSPKIFRLDLLQPSMSYSAVRH